VAKTAAKVVALSQPVSAPDDLHAQRDALMAEVARLSKVDAARREVEAKLAALAAEQAQIDAAEREAWRAWAEHAEGQPPSPKTAEREDLAKRRRLLAGDLQAALNGQTAVAPRLEALHAQLTQVGLKIFEQTIAALVDEAEALNADLHAAAATFLALCEQRDGLRDAVDASLSRPVNRQNEARAELLRAALWRIEQLERPNASAGDAQKREQHAAAYARRLA
jgi:hypothetical protein